MTRLRFLIVALALWLPAIATAQPTDEVRYFHLDAIGSVRVVTDASGQVVARHDYAPFGQEWQPPTVSNVRRFGGKEFDAETQYDYFGGRFYRSASGRFTSADPALNLEGALADPQRWNRYAYARNNPLVFVDPDGRDIVRPFSAYEIHLMAKAGELRDRVAAWLGGGTDHPLGRLGAGVVDALLAGVLPRDSGEFAAAANASILGIASPLGTVGEAFTARRGITVLGHYPGYQQRAEAIGARFFNVPARIWSQLSPSEQWAANVKFLDRLIKRRDVIELSTPAGQARPGSFFARELQYLLQRGYTLNEAGTRLSPPLF